MMMMIILVVIVVLLVLFVISGFNKLRTADVKSQESLSGIDVMQTKRADLVPNLVETVKGYAGHEKTVLEDVTNARANVESSVRGNDVAQKASADNQMTSALGRINVVAENYPDLKANSNFLELQRQLASIENEIAFARQYYNDAAGEQNKLISTLPWMMFSGMTGVHKRDFYKGPEGSSIPPQVKFN